MNNEVIKLPFPEEKQSYIMQIIYRGRRMSGQKL